MTTTTSPILSEKAYTDGYEQLRCHALQPGTIGHRYGWILVIRSGVASWLDAFTEPPDPSSLPTRGEIKPPVINRGGTADRIDILAAMVKAHLEAA